MNFYDKLNDIYDQYAYGQNNCTKLLIYRLESLYNETQFSLCLKYRDAIKAGYLVDRVDYTKYKKMIDLYVGAIYNTYIDLDKRFESIYDPRLLGHKDIGKAYSDICLAIQIIIRGNI